MILRHSICFALLFGSISFGDEPQLLDDQFVLPKGFHIYRVADNKLTGSSYDLTFDGQGNLLVADGNAVRRLKDVNGDQVYDSFEVIADGKATSGRGPQGLLVYGDHLYVVAGDGVQLGGEAQDVVITDLKDHTYFAVIRVMVDGELIDVDSRPSDAIALSVHYDPHLPIYVSEDVLGEAAM